MENQITTTNPNQFLDFSAAKVQSITMDQLRRTVRENYPYADEDGNLKPISGIYHFDFFDRVTGMCNELGYQTEFYDMFAAQNKDGRTPGVALVKDLERQYGDRAVEAHTLRRVYANVRLLDFDTDEHTTNLAIAFHQRGIQAGFGNMVKICHNQCMLHADRYGATYGARGEEKYEIEGLLQLIRSWLVDARHIIETDRKRIEKMKSLPVTADEVIRLIGLLTATRVKWDNSKLFPDAVEYPLNQSQISEYTKDLMLRYDETHALTVWDLYDAGTNLFKATSMDMPLVLPKNLRMVEFLEQNFDF